LRSEPPSINLPVRVLVFRHTASDDLGLIAPALDEQGILRRYADLYSHPCAESLVNEADALIFMGGPMSANDGHPYIQREIQYIRDAKERGQMVLGVCLGAQLIAKALGASVHANTVKEIGWAPVTFTPAAANDPLFAGLHEAEMIFHWHGETFTVPPGAELLGSSEACRNQAFRVGNRIYGLQFHLEVTPSMIAEWCREDEACGNAREVTQPIDPYAHATRSGELARLVFGRWCALLKDRACAAS
jgi:GMP synthase-like glutamine amidotransferase